MKNLFNVSLSVMIICSTAVSFAKNSQSNSSGSVIASITSEVRLSRSDDSFTIAKNMVAESDCFKTDIAKYGAIFLGLEGTKNVILEKSAVLLAKDGVTLYKITAEKETGISLLEVGAWSLKKCSDFKEINE